MGVTQIEVHNIQWATHQAMRQALLRLRSVPDYVLVDGSIPKLHLPQEGVIKGDQRCNCIAAASIVAKVVRDRLMVEYDGVYPQYGFARHKGYATAEHIADPRPRPLSTSSSLILSSPLKGLWTARSANKEEKSD